MLRGAGINIDIDIGHDISLIVWTAIKGFPADYNARQRAP
ncbi:hypothetical protein AAKU55_004164 [Oxalobacteraceae bacterium GrIS 1.11]